RCLSDPSHEDILTHKQYQHGAECRQKCGRECRLCSYCKKCDYMRVFEAVHLANCGLNVICLALGSTVTLRISRAGWVQFVLRLASFDNVPRKVRLVGKVLHVRFSAKVRRDAEHQTHGEQILQAIVGER